MRIKLALLEKSRPDVSFEVSRLAQVTEQMSNSVKNKQACWLRRALKYAGKDGVFLEMPKLGLSSIKNIGFSDSSFSINRYHFLQLRSIWFLGAETEAAPPVSFKSWRAKRVTRSAMSVEAAASSGFFNNATMLAGQLRAVPLNWHQFSSW